MRIWTIIVCLVVGVGMSAQTPSFAGAWRVNHSAGEPPSASTSELIWDVTQTATELRIRTVVNGRETASHAWPLDGTAVQSMRDGIPASTSVAIGKGELVIAGTATLTNGDNADVREQWIIDPSTKSLRVLKVMSSISSTFTRRLVLDPVARP